MMRVKRGTLRNLQTSPQPAIAQEQLAELICQVIQNSGSITFLGLHANVNRNYFSIGESVIHKVLNQLIAQGKVEKQGRFHILVTPKE